MMPLLQASPSTGGGLTMSGLILIILIVVFMLYKAFPKSKLAWQMWALTYNINHYGHGSFEVDASVKKIVTMLMEKDGIKVNVLDITHEIGSRYQGTLFSDNGNYNVTILADRSGSVNYTIKNRIEY
jgi:hypothetical protein